MDKHCKAMLKYIQANVPDDGIWFADFYPRYAKTSGLSEERVAALFKKLKEGEYVRIKKAGGRPVGFTCDYRGFWTKEDKVERIKVFLIKSVLIPIVVAIVVAFATAWITAYVNGWSTTKTPEQTQSQNQPEPTQSE